MPIIGVTDQGARYPRLGTIRKGDVKPQTGNAPGRDLGEALRFVGADEEVQRDWTQALGSDRLSAVTVRLAYPTVDQCWTAWKEVWVTGGLVRRCNGRDTVLWRDEQGEYHGPELGGGEPAKPCLGEKCGCKEVGRLEVFVPALPRLGTVTVMTTSIHDILNIDGCLRAVEAAFGDLTRIPLRLKRVQRAVSCPDGKNPGKRVRMQKWLLALEVEPTWVRYMLDTTAATTPALAGETPRALPAPDPYDEDGSDVLEDEAPPVNGWRDRIGAVETWAAWRALYPDIEAVEPDQKKANVRRLWFGRGVEIIRGTAELATYDQLASMKKALEAMPEGVNGVSGALDLVTGYQEQLITRRTGRPVGVGAPMAPAKAEMEVLL